MKFSQAEPTVTYALICPDVYYDSTSFRKIAAQAAIIVLFAAGLIGTFVFTSRMSLFPIKERAPKLALLQCLLFLMIVAIPYASDFFAEGWSTAQSPAEIPFSRKAFKAFYLSCRLFCYILFGLRTVIIYSNWKLSDFQTSKMKKKGESQQVSNFKKALRRIFRTEDNSLVVG